MPGITGKRSKPVMPDGAIAYPAYGKVTWLPDGAVAYPAYGESYVVAGWRCRLSGLRGKLRGCRMALSLIRPTGKDTWLPDGAVAYPAYGESYVVAGWRYRLSGLRERYVVTGNVT
ncbi:hypothetical protein [Citrobacter sp. MGH110]|uniref:hypothetical protein n=1 Tax=Citrobacter sp. MGH110 TaxID=1686383 RepID=UPI0012E1F559|nr:hypothetical protein [Citrobacter sp. MGH110]